jgi:hypothetical protein
VAQESAFLATPGNVGCALAQALSNIGGRVSRTFVIGDVHGCLAELDQLLAAASLAPSDDVVFVGDLIGRGPDPLGVINRALEIGARSVQGNHERQLMQLLDTGTSTAAPAAQESRQRLIQQLEARHVQWLRAMPLFIQLEQHQACVVHAGIVPGVALLAQDPWALTHMRSLDAEGRPVAQLGDESWACSYKGPLHVVFGHSAQRGLQLHQFATGLDTGCVYGGSLTGLLLNDGEGVLAASTRHTQLIRVPAREIYCSPH